MRDTRRKPRKRYGTRKTEYCHEAGCVQLVTEGANYCLQHAPLHREFAPIDCEDCGATFQPTNATAYRCAECQTRAHRERNRRDLAHLRARLKEAQPPDDLASMLPTPEGYSSIGDWLDACMAAAGASENLFAAWCKVSNATLNRLRRRNDVGASDRTLEALSIATGSDLSKLRTLNPDWKGARSEKLRSVNRNKFEDPAYARQTIARLRIGKAKSRDERVGMASDVIAEMYEERSYPISRIASKFGVDPRTIQARLHWMGYNVPLPRKYMPSERLAIEEKLAAMDHDTLVAILEGRHRGGKTRADAAAAERATKYWPVFERYAAIWPNLKAPNVWRLIVADARGTKPTAGKAYDEWLLSRSGKTA